MSKRLMISEEELQELKRSERRRAKLKKLLDGTPPDEALIRRFKANVIRIKISDMFDAVAENPDHPIAHAWAKTLRIYKDKKDKQVVVEREDLEGLINNRQVLILGDRDDPGLYFKTVDEPIGGIIETAYDVQKRERQLLLF